MLVLLGLDWLVSKETLLPCPPLLLLNSDGIGTWEELCMVSCPHGRAATRTWKNLLSLSYSSKLLCETG